MQADLICAYLAVELGDYERGREYLRQALGKARDMGKRRSVSRILLALKWLKGIDSEAIPASPVGEE